MPTGYTAALFDGKEQTFEQFAMRCARAMGVLIIMREEPLDEPIPERFEHSTHYRDKLRDAREELETVCAMTQGEVEEAAQEEFAQALESYRSLRKDKNETEARYRAMLEQVDRWEPPTSEHKSFKTFMQEQLKSSIDADCRYEPMLPVKKSGEGWREVEIRRLMKDISRFRESDDDERQMTEGINRWIKELRCSLA